MHLCGTRGRWVKYVCLKYSHGLAQLVKMVYRYKMPGNVYQGVIWFWRQHWQSCCWLKGASDDILPISFYKKDGSEVERGVYCFHLVCLSVHLSIHQSLDMSTLCLQQYSLDPFSYLYTLSSNFRRCVVCKNFLAKFQNLNIGKFFKFVTLTLSWFELGFDMNQ